MNEVRIYSLAFSIGMPPLNFGALQTYLTDSREILGYWGHIPFIYFIKSRLLASHLARRLQPFLETGHYVLVEVNPANMDGWLPKDLWAWFYADHSEKREPGWGAETFPQLFGPHLDQE
jgi:hypothetical protein